MVPVRRLVDIVQDLVENIFWKVWVLSGYSGIDPPTEDADKLRTVITQM
jgi:hypothetical protein